MADFQVEIPESDAAARERVQEVLSTLNRRVDGIRQRQAEAMTVTGSATSRDGTVSATVDATGVLTALQFAPSAFERSSPDKLARAVVATVQQAAAGARQRIGDSVSALSEQDEGIAAARRGAARFGVEPATVPAVPRTESDPTGMPDAFQQPAESAAEARRATEEEFFEDDGNTGGNVMDNGKRR